MEINKFKHHISIKVRFSDIDAMGHVNNATYLSYLEEARIAYFNKVLNYTENNLAFGAVVAKIDIDYISQIKLGDDVEIYTKCGNFGNKSSDIENLIVIKKAGENIIAAKVKTKLVSFDYKLRKSVPIPLDVKTKIAAFENS